MLAGDIVSYVKMILDSKRVDTCTAAVRKCYQTKCNGEDYPLCVGMDYDYMVDMCTDDISGESDTIAMQCSGKGDIKEYVKRVARGIFLEIDNELSRHCRNAVSEAMRDICGGTTYCDADTAGLNYKEFWRENITYKICPDGNTNSTECVDDVNNVPLDIDTDTKWRAVIETNNMQPTEVKFDGLVFTKVSGSKIPEDMLERLNRDYERVKGSIMANNTVKSCIWGNKKDTGDGFGGEEGSYKGGPKYENITSSANQTIADSIMKALISQYNERTMDVYTDIMSAYANIGKQKTKTDEERKALCEAMDNDLATSQDIYNIDYYASSTKQSLDIAKGALSTTAIYLADKYLCRIEFLISFSDYEGYRTKQCVDEECDNIVYSDATSTEQKSVLPPVNYIYYYDMTNVTLKCHMQIEDGFYIYNDCPADIVSR